MKHELERQLHDEMVMRRGSVHSAIKKVMGENREVWATEMFPKNNPQGILVGYNVLSYDGVVVKERHIISDTDKEKVCQEIGIL